MRNFPLSFILLAISVSLVVIACSKIGQTPEQITPSAQSSFSKVDMLKVANNWADVDRTTRSVGLPEPSGSMLRVFDSTSVILLEKVKITDTLRVGDIYTYVNPSLTVNEVSHRLVRFDYNGDLIFKGDNNSNEDPPVDRSAVRSRITGILYTSGI